jgi:diguanylate cyclase (GGDEF)-like protein/PAS domain S-box-containing protein
MDKNKLDNLQFEDILKIRKELEEYINTIDEYVITSKTDLQGVITYTSKAFEKISGYKEVELLGKPHNIIRHPDMSSEIFEDMWKTIAQEKIWSGEIKNLKKDGSFYWVNTKITPAYDHEGKHVGYTSVRQDISDKKKMQEEALTDELTGLYNRRYFNQVIDSEIKRTNRDNKVFSFLILDIDYFKNYNDNYGHQQGDYALQTIGTFLRMFFKRATDIVFRLGGEEFCIIYTTDTKEQATTLANTLLKELEALKIEHKFSKISEYLTVSIGMAICDFTDEQIKSVDPKNLYAQADKELYTAKNSGRNRVSHINIE